MTWLTVAVWMFTVAWALMERRRKRRPVEMTGPRRWRIEYLQRGRSRVMEIATDTEVDAVKLALQQGVPHDKIVSLRPAR